MTFNVLYAGTSPSDTWPERRPILRECVRSVAPDVFGVQEPTFRQVREIAADLSEFEWIGLGTEGGSRGGINAVFFRKDRFEPIEFDHFWLSDTPEVMASNTWDAKYRRAVSWVKLADKRSARQFYLANTHFDHISETARVKSAQLTRRRLLDLKGNLPIILTGDFNTDVGKSPTYQALSEGGIFADALMVAPEIRGRQIDSFHGFKPPTNTGKRIDWILINKAIRVKAGQIVEFSKDGHYPSDHFPVVAWLELE